VNDQHPTVRAEVPAELCGPAPPSRDTALTPTAYVIQGNVPFGEWVQHGRRLGVIGRSAGWWIGDWLSYGNARYGDRYARASRITGYDAQTLMNMVYVASRFEPSRRREGLSWSHHAELAALPPEDQERWLTRAESDRLSVRCLREEIRRERRTIDEARRQGQLPARAGAHEPEPAERAHCPSCGELLPPTQADEDDAAAAPIRRRGGARRKGPRAPLSAPVAATAD
jgi:hypothetical protein